MADSISVAASVTWIVYANEKIEDNEPKPGGYETNRWGVEEYVPASSGDPSKISNYKWLRAGGYGALALFGVSAIYGWVIENQCRALKQELAAKSNPRLLEVASKWPGFPASVLDFSFESPPAQAEQQCFALGRKWSLESNQGLCRSTLGAPDVQLDYELGVPRRITVIYRSKPEQLAERYRALMKSVSNIYGPPQTSPQPLSSTCVASLASCLQNDEHPGGPVWRWARGTIVLRPVWRDDSGLLELQYERKEPEAG